MVEYDPSLEKVNGRIICLSIIVVAVCVRLPMVFAGYPYISYIDEGYVLHPIIRMLSNTTWDPGWYIYPSMLMYCIAVPAKLFFSFRGIIAGEPVIFNDRFGSITYYDIIEPPELIIIGRLIVALFAIGIVYLVWHLGSRLLGTWGGAIAALAAALMPALVGRGAIVIIDTPATFFIWASICCAYYIPRVKNPERAVAAAGVCAGCAFATKYPCGAVGVVALTTLIFFQAPILRRLKLIVLLGGTASLAVFCATPPLLFRFKSVYAAIRAEGERQFSSTHIFAQKAKFSFIEQIISPAEVGLIVCIAAFIGCCWLLYNQKFRKLMLGIGCFFAIVLIVYVPSHYKPFRHLLPLVPFLCICVGACCTMFLSLVSNRRLHGPLAVGCMAVLVYVTLPSTVTTIAERVSILDSRTAVFDWLVMQTKKSDTVLIAEELVFLPSQIQHLPGRVVVRPESSLQSRFMDIPENAFIIMSSAGYKDLCMGGKGTQFGVKEKQKSLRTIFSVGSHDTVPIPYYWKRNDQRIVVLQK